MGPDSFVPIVGAVALPRAVLFPHLPFGREWRFLARVYDACQGYSASSRGFCIDPKHPHPTCYWQPLASRSGARGGGSRRVGASSRAAVGLGGRRGLFLGCGVAVSCCGLVAIAVAGWLTVAKSSGGPVVDLFFRYMVAREVVEPQASADGAHEAEGRIVGRDVMALRGAARTDAGSTNVVRKGARAGARVVAGAPTVANVAPPRLAARRAAGPDVRGHVRVEVRTDTHRAPLRETASRADSVESERIALPTEWVAEAAKNAPGAHADFDWAWIRNRRLTDDPAPFLQESTVAATVRR